jgi:hypothetical protein
MTASALGRVDSRSISSLCSAARLPTIVAMLHQPHKLAALTAALVVVFALGGCATGLNRDQCIAADWRMIGYEDGLHGQPADRISAHRVACATHQVTPNLTAYSEGRERGLVEYCQARNGFRVGLAGAGYANVCSAATEPAFVGAYRWGRQIHDARAELHTTRSRLRGARDALGRTDAAMASVTTELVLPNVPTDRRAYLAQELVRLTQERSELVGRIDQLALQIEQLSASVQTLERQSPYPL